MHASDQTPATSTNVAADVILALSLAAGRPTGPAAEALRQRLRGYIAQLADPAGTYAGGLADSRAKEIAENTVRHARAVATDPVTDPAANLRLLAKSADMLARYAVAGRPVPQACPSDSPTATRSWRPATRGGPGGEHPLSTPSGTAPPVPVHIGGPHRS